MRKKISIILICSMLITSFIVVFPIDKAKAIDIYGLESDWSDPLVVNMPRFKAFNGPFLNWLQSHPNMFPILQILLQRLGL